MTDETTTSTSPEQPPSGRKRGRIAKATGAAAAIAALAIPVGWAIGPASAQDDTTTTTDATAPDTDGAHGHADATNGAGGLTIEQRQERRQARRAERESLVAEKLGVTADELRTARLAVLEDKLQERVDAGRITQERADEILQAAKDGHLRELRRQLRRDRVAARNGTGGN
jgi:hypothetical protein